MNNLSLKKRIIIVLISVFLMIFLFLSLYFYELKDSLRRSLMLIQAQEIGATISSKDEIHLLPSHHTNSQLAYTLYSSTGELIWYSDHLSKPRRLRHTTLQDETRLFSSFIYSGKVINVPVQLTDGSTLMVSKNDETERQLIDTLLKARLLSSFLLFLPICCFLLWLIRCLLNWSLRPIEQAATLCKKIGPTNPQLRIPLAPLPLEIRPLAKAANTSLDRVHKALEIEKNLVADAAHELRTPLTLLDLQLQKSQLEKQVNWSTVHASLAQLRRLVNQLLRLAHEEHMVDQAPPKQPIFVSRIVRENIAQLLPAIEAAHRPLHISIPDHLLGQGNAIQLSEAIKNVLENALLHGQGTIGITITQQHQRILIDISDQGKGIKETEKERIFDRFHKATQHSSGSGLGLAIAKKSVENLGGKIYFLSTFPCVVRIEILTWAERKNKVNQR